MELVSDKVKSSRLKQFGRVAFGALVVTGFAIALTRSFSRTVVVRNSQWRLETILPATIRPHTLATINAGFPGRVTVVHVAPGSNVKAGDGLITLASSDFECEYDRAKLHFESAQQKLAHQDLAGHTERQLEAAERTLNAAKERLGDSSLDEVQRAYEKDSANLREVQNLVQRQLATEIELQQARKGAQTGLQNLRAAREHLSRLREEVETAQATVDNLKDPHSSSAADALSLQIELREAAEALRIATLRRDSQNILATVAGTVLRTMVTAGDEIPSGVPLLQLAQLDQLDFDVPVSAEIARRVKVGDTVKVRVPTEPPMRVSAPVSAVVLIPAQDQAPFTVRITMQNPSHSIVLVGLTGEVEFPHPGASWRVFPF
jgi:multidrug resistance efflux pump